MTLSKEEIIEIVNKALKDQGEGVPASFMNLLKREGEDTLQASLTLYTENFELRQDKRNLKAELDTAKKASNVPEDQVLVSKEDGELLENYKKLGTVEEIGKTSTDFSSMQRSQILSTVAKTAGYESGVFDRLAGELIFEERKETIDGKEVPYIVVLPGEGKEAVKIEEYAEANWKDFLPALKPENGGDTQTTSTTRGTEFVKQKGAGDSTKPQSVLEKHLDAREERYNKTKGPLDSKE